MYSDEMNNNESGYRDNNRNIKIIICGVLALIVVILAIVLIVKNGKKNAYTVKIMPENGVTISLGNTFNLSAIVTSGKGENITNPSIRWSSDNQNIVVVTDGSVTGINYGKTYITASYITSNGKNYQAKKEVLVADGDINIPLSDATIVDGELTLPLNDSYQIKVEVNPSNAYVNSREFTSSNQSVAIVNSQGLITAIGEGEATISVSLNNGAVTKSISVKVRSDITEASTGAYPTSIAIDNSLTTIKVGETKPLGYTVSPSGARTDKLIWTSSDPNVLTVDSTGNITGVSAGTAKVTVTSDNNVSSEIDITVEGSEITKIDFNQPEITFDAMNQANMTITIGVPIVVIPVVTPANPTNPMLDFTAKNSTIINITIDPTGTSATIDGLKTGTTELTVKSSNGIENKVIVTVVRQSGSSNSSSSSSRCYCNSSGRCSWLTGKTNDYTELQSSIPNNTACTIYSNNNKTACFKDSNGDYKWGNYGNSSGYSYVPGVTSPSNCNSNSATTEGITCENPYKGKTGKCTITSSNNAKIVSASSSDNNIAKITGQDGYKVTFECTSNNKDKTEYVTISVTTSNNKTVSKSISCRGESQVFISCPSTATVGDTVTCTVYGLNSASELKSCSSSAGTSYKNGTTCVVKHDKAGAVTVTAETSQGTKTANVTFQTKGNSTSCVNIGTVGECNAQNNCEWNYSYGCRDKNKATASPSTSSSPMPTTSSSGCDSCVELCKQNPNIYGGNSDSNCRNNVCKSSCK